MNHIIVLNWNSSKQTILCLESLLKLYNNFENRIIICDNDSELESYNLIYDYLNENLLDRFVAFNENEDLKIIKQKDIYLIKNNKNYGYAGGNNVGIKFSLNFEDLENIWILNNDTIVEPDSLNHMIHKLKQDDNYGLVGSKLVELENKFNVQGVGGIINPLFCTTKEIGCNLKINDHVDELEYEKKIDYVIGASLLISRKCIEQVGILCENYFLYYEEIDYCNRARAKGFKIGIASRSIVYHECGASTNKGKSIIADYYSVKNRLLISKKYYKSFYIFVWFSLFFVFLNRIRRSEFLKAKNVLNIIIHGGMYGYH